jgi:hypothetical protein
MIPAIIGGKKGHSPFGYFLFGLVFFLPALIVALLIQPKAARGHRGSRDHRIEDVFDRPWICSECSFRTTNPLAAERHRRDTTELPAVRANSSLPAQTTGTIAIRPSNAYGLGVGRSPNKRTRAASPRPGLPRSSRLPTRLALTAPKKSVQPHASAAFVATCSSRSTCQAELPGVALAR